MDGGAALRAKAISAFRSMRYCSIGGMLGYFVVASAARACGDAHKARMASVQVPNMISLAIFPFIDSPSWQRIQKICDHGLNRFARMHTWHVCVQTQTE